MKANCIKCRKYKNNEENCGIFKKIEITQFMERVAAEVFFPVKKLKANDDLSKYTCTMKESIDLKETKKEVKQVRHEQTSLFGGNLK